MDCLFASRRNFTSDSISSHDWARIHPSILESLALIFRTPQPPDTDDPALVITYAPGQPEGRRPNGRAEIRAALEAAGLTAPQSSPGSPPNQEVYTGSVHQCFRGQTAVHALGWPRSQLGVPDLGVMYYVTNSTSKPYVQFEQVDLVFNAI